MSAESDNLAKQCLTGAPGADSALAVYLLKILPRWITASFDRITPQDVDELASLVTVHILKKIDLFRGESSFDTWARTVTRNRVKSWLRERALCWKRETILDIEDGEKEYSPYNAISLPIKNPRQEVDRKECLELAKQAFERVKNPRQRLILKEYYIGGLSVAEIAKRWGVKNRDNLDVLLCRAKKVYFEILKEMMGEGRLVKCSPRVLRR